MAPRVIGVGSPTLLFFTNSRPAKSTLHKNISGQALRDDNESIAEPESEKGQVGNNGISDCYPLTISDYYLLPSTYYFQQHDILNMVRMRKHVHWLHFADGVLP